MVALSAIIYGSYGVWSRFLGNSFGAFTQGYVRSAVVLAVLVPFALVTHALTPVAVGDRKWVVMSTVCAVFTAPTMYYAFTHMDIGAAMLIMYSAILLSSYVVGVVFLSEKMDIPKYASFVLALIGLAIIFGVSFGTFSLLAVVSAATFGVAVGGEVSITKRVTERISSLQMVICLWVGILLVAPILAVLMHEGFPSPGPVWVVMCGFGFSGVIASWLVVEGFRYVDASIGSLIGLFEVISAVAFGVVLFHERLKPETVAGGILILVASALPDAVAYAKHRKGKAGHLPLAT